MFNPLLQYMPLYRWTSKYTIETHQIENVVNPFIQKVCAYNTMKPYIVNNKINFYKFVRVSRLPEPGCPYAQK